MPNPQTVNEEAGLGPEWIPVDQPPIIPGKPVLGIGVSVDSSPKYLQGSLPPAQQHDTSFVGTAYEGGGIPKLSLMPLGVQGQPSTNAGVQSTSKIIVEASPSSSGGGPTGILGISSGGTGTANPSLSGSTDVLVTGTWPVQTVQEVTGLLNNPLPSLTTGYLEWNGSAWVFGVPGGGFVASGDLTGTSISQEVVGLLSNPLPSLTAGVLEWTGSAWAFAPGAPSLISVTSASQVNVSLSSLTVVASTAIDGFWVFSCSVTSSAETDGTPDGPLMTVTIAGLTSSGVDFNGLVVPWTLTPIFPITLTNTSVPIFLPAGSAIHASTTLTLGSGGALTYTINVKAKML